MDKIAFVICELLIQLKIAEYPNEIMWNNYETRNTSLRLDMSPTDNTTEDNNDEDEESLYKVPRDIPVPVTQYQDASTQQDDIDTHDEDDNNIEDTSSLSDNPG